MDTLQWMGAVRMRVETADKEIPKMNNPSNNVQSEKLFACKKLIVKTVLALNGCFSSAII